jgi:hypothetical protein
MWRVMMSKKEKIAGKYLKRKILEERLDRLSFDSLAKIIDGNEYKGYTYRVKKVAPNRVELYKEQPRNGKILVRFCGEYNKVGLRNLVRNTVEKYKKHLG